MATIGIHRYAENELSNISLGQIGFDMLSISSDWTNITPADTHEAKIAYGGVWKKINSENFNNPFEIGETVIFLDELANALFSDGDYFGVNDEICQVHSPTGIVGTATTRAHFGTVEANHAIDDQLWLYKRVGDHFKYWNSIYNCSEFSGGGLALEVQIKPYDTFDNIISSDNTFDPSSNTKYITLAAGEFLTGRFSHIAIQKPTAGTATVKLNKG